MAENQWVTRVITRISGVITGRSHFVETIIYSFSGCFRPLTPLRQLIYKSVGCFWAHLVLQFVSATVAVFKGKRLMEI